MTEQPAAADTLETHLQVGRWLGPRAQGLILLLRRLLFEWLDGDAAPEWLVLTDKASREVLGKIFLGRDASSNGLLRARIEEDLCRLSLSDFLEAWPVQGNPSPGPDIS